MLKSIIINDVKTPIPVPVRTLGEALDWFSETLLADEKVATSICFDGEDITDQMGSGAARSVKVEANSVLEVQVESPEDLVMNCLDTICRLSQSLFSQSRVLAANLWQAHGDYLPADLMSFLEDVKITLQLIDHLSEIVDATGVSIAGVLANGKLIARTVPDLDRTRREQDWQGSARIVLNRMAPCMKDLSREAESLYISLVANPSGLVKQSS